MRKIFEFFRKHSWMWVIVVVILAIIGDAYLTRVQKPVATPTPVAQVATFRNITPGVSSVSDLNKIWGSPLKSTTANGQTTDEYKSTSQSRNSIAIVQSGTVYLIREIISATDTQKASDITSVYGAPPYTLYQKFPNSYFNLYVYPSNGIAYLGHSDGTLQEIWYFPPTTIENFQSTWAPDYLTSPPTEQLQ